MLHTTCKKTSRNYIQNMKDMFEGELKIKKALVALAIEQSLLEFGEPLYDFVVTTLEKKYDCYLPACYEHPEYLGEILVGIQGNVSSIIFTSIYKKLADVSEYQGITSFLGLLETHMKLHDMMEIYRNGIRKLSK